MAGGISVHVVDVTRGVPAKGLKIEVFMHQELTSSSGRPLAAGILAANGMLDHPIVSGKGVDRGIYEVVFYIGDFYRQLGYPVPELPFLDIVPFRFGIDDVEQHYHLPLKVSPWGFSLFRGG